MRVKDDGVDDKNERDGYSRMAKMMKMMQG
jgi:hypothetical protein